MAGKRKQQSKDFKTSSSSIFQNPHHEMRIFPNFSHNQTTLSIHFADFESSLPAGGGLQCRFIILPPFTDPMVSTSSLDSCGPISDLLFPSSFQVLLVYLLTLVKSDMSGSHTRAIYRCCGLGSRHLVVIEVVISFF